MYNEFLNSSPGRSHEVRLPSARRAISSSFLQHEEPIPRQRRRLAHSWRQLRISIQAQLGCPGVSHLITRLHSEANLLSSIAKLYLQEMFRLHSIPLPNSLQQLSRDRLGNIRAHEVRLLAAHADI